MTASGQVGGACLCGAVRFRVALPTLFCAHCHCSMCRRNHGAGYVTWIGVPYERFAIEKGEDALVTYASSDTGTRKFCGRCGTSLFCENTKHPDHVDIPLANLDGPIDRDPQVHMFFDCRAPWVAIGDALPKVDEKKP
jgi:hypothetical protein